MDFIRCQNCGRELTEEMNVCPSCGCPVSHANATMQNANAYSNQTAFTPNPIPQPVPQPIQQPINQPQLAQASKGGNMAKVSMIIGILIILIGCVTLFHKSNAVPYFASDYNVSSIQFGADFYTEIYNASDTIVDELNDINSGVASVSNSSIAAINAAYFCSGMVIIALGLVVVAFSLINMGKTQIQ